MGLYNNIKWGKEFVYALGLFTADGNLSKDGRHLEFCSKDKDQVKNFKRCLNLTNNITMKGRGYSKEKVYYHIQFGNVALYKFCNSIGLNPQKSLTIKKVEIPDEFFADFLRGLLDGDGSIGMVMHPESRIPQIRLRFTSASYDFIKWLREQIILNTNTGGGSIYKAARAWQLLYCKRDTLNLIKYMYYKPNIPCLKRKFVVSYNLLKMNSHFNPARWGNRYTRV